MNLESDHILPAVGRPYFGFWLGAVMALLVWGLAGLNAEAGAQDRKADPYTPVVVVDPGHGGSDAGAKGSEGTLEKVVTLNLARILAAEMEGRYRVVLTRSDDYGVDLYGRTAVANQEGADLFISLHAGGSFLHQAGGLNVYFYQDSATPPLSPAVMATAPLKGTGAQTTWEKIQLRHKTSSKMLAQLIQDRISEQALFSGNPVQGAPLGVLQGADMPAVVVETGYLSRPAEESALRDANVLTLIAQSIGRAIDDYFAKVR